MNSSDIVVPAEHDVEASQELVDALRKTGTDSSLHLILAYGTSVELPPCVTKIVFQAARAFMLNKGVQVKAHTEWLSRHEIADMINCSKEHVTDLIAQGKLKSEMQGRWPKVKLTDVLAFMEEQDKYRDAAMSEMIAFTESIGGYDSTIEEVPPGT